MSRWSLNVETKNLGEFTIRLKNAADPLRTRIALQQIGLMVIRRTRQLHREQRSPWGVPWKPLAPATVAKKGHSIILMDTGNLTRSYRAILEGNDTVRVGPGMNALYARFHQYGTARIPRRPIMPLDQTGRVRLPSAYRKELEDIITRVLIRPVQGGGE